MSEYEAELRRRLAGAHLDIYETMFWFLAAIDAQAYAAGKPGAPDVSEFERKFLVTNIERYHKARAERMSIIELLSTLADMEPEPDQPWIDMTGFSDREVIRALDTYFDCALAELVKRANAKCATLDDYLRDVFLEGRP